MAVPIVLCAIGASDFLWPVVLMGMPDIGLVFLFSGQKESAGTVGFLWVQPDSFVCVWLHSVVGGRLQRVVNPLYLYMYTRA